ncbi:MAG: asparagine synthase (glutamine-hydrolyzing) [Vicinamibacterales bacterium]
MCGIAGKIAGRGALEDAEATVRAMCRALAHRGPDGEGVVRRGPAILGHRRLAIIDLSADAAQPMALPDQSLWIVFNGEIYNYRELRAELERAGHSFVTRSDTEVILHAFQEFGDDCVRRLRGMFAFALWDERRQRLFAARDRVGKKPFLYRFNSDGFTFASEMQGLAADPASRLEPDLPVIDAYLTYGYVPGGQSAFRGVRRLPPAHHLTYEDGGVREVRYWTARRTPKLRISEDDAAAETLRILREAVRLRLISDVPLGAFLSGGVDSSLIVALMAEHGTPRTFSIGFEEAAYDERRFAAGVASHCQTAHTEFVVRPDAASVLPTLVRHYGEPYADSSAVPTYYLSRLTRQHVTVALNGDGGDEAFGGYERYAATAVAARVDRLPRGVIRLLASGARALNRKPRKAGTLHRLDRFLEAAPLAPVERYSRWVTLFSESQKAHLCTAAFRRASAGPPLAFLERAYAESDALDFVDATLHADLVTYLPDDLLVKVDIASMANSLEVRSPLLDHELIEFCARLPIDYKIQGLQTKVLLKRIARQFSPAEVIDRPKAGFGVPIDRWLRHELRDVVDDCLLGSRALSRGYFRREALEQLVDEHLRGRRRWHHLIWAIVMLELWHREFIDGQPRPSIDSRSWAETAP